MVNIRDVAVEACFRVIVGEKTDILKLPTKDWKLLEIAFDKEERNALSTRKTIDLALDPSLGAAT